MLTPRTTPNPPLEITPIALRCPLSAERPLATVSDSIAAVRKNPPEEPEGHCLRDRRPLTRRKELARYDAGLGLGAKAGAGEGGTAAASGG